MPISAAASSSNESPARGRSGPNASQAVFARYLDVTTSLVSQWERGERRPRGASLKLLSLVARKGLRAMA